MHKRTVQCRDEVVLANVMVYFVFLGAATVAVALAAHLH
jgi:hypothetical protein